MPSFAVPKILLLAVLALLTPVASALDGAWTDPSGRFSLNFASLGWSEQQNPPSDPELLIALEHRAFQEAGEMRACIVTERSEPIPDRVTQDQINELFSVHGLAEMERSTRATSIDSEQSDVDGVRVITARLAEPLHQEVLAFYVKDGTTGVRILINCGIEGSAPTEVTDNIERLFRTLRIHPSRSDDSI